MTYIVPAIRSFLKHNEFELDFKKLHTLLVVDKAINKINKNKIVDYHNRVKMDRSLWVSSFKSGMPRI